MTEESEMGVMWPQAKEHLEPPEAARDNWCPLRAFKGSLTLPFGVPATRTAEEDILLF